MAYYNGKKILSLNNLTYVTDNLKVNFNDNSIKGIVPTVADLPSTGAANEIYIVADTGHWYYYQDAWLDGGVYQATEIADGSITPKKTSFIETNVIYEKDLLSLNYDTNGIWVSKNVRIDNVKPNTQYTCFIKNTSGVFENTRVIYIQQFDSSKNKIKETPTEPNIFNDIKLSITTLENVSYLVLKIHATNATASPVNGTATFEEIEFFEGTERIEKLKNEITAMPPNNSITKEKIVDKSIILSKLENKIIEGIENASALSDITDNSTILTKFINKWGAFETYSTYSCRELNIDGGEIFYLTGKHWNNGPLYAFYKDNELLSVGELGGEYHEVIENVRVVAPNNANKLYLNIGINNNGSFDKNTIKTYTEYFNKSSEQNDYINNYINYDIRGNSLLNQNNKNPFKYSQFDKPYFVMVFDDGRKDLDLVAAICEEYNIPLSVAIPPQTLTNICNGLTSAKGSYSVGMTIKEVCNKIVELGGEVLAHRYEVVTIENQYNNEFMYDHFVTTKKQLEENGFKIRGIIKAGGGNEISDYETKETLKWCLKFYDYSDRYAPPTNIQYGKYRNTFYGGIDGGKTLFNDLKTNYQTTFKWLMAHTLDGTETNMTEANFRAIIEYALSIGVTFTTMAYLFDNFRSSELEERIKALEA